MDKKNCSELNNSELKLYMESLNNEFEAKKAKIKELCNELVELENAFNEAQSEMNIRRRIF